MSRSPDLESRYPGYDVLDRWSSPDFDDQTRDAIRRRLERVPDIRFFDDHEVRLLASIVARIVPQPDREPREQVPIVPWIDRQLHEDRRRGFRYHDTPPPRDAWRIGLRAIDDEAGRRFGHAFIDLEEARQDAVLDAVARGDVQGPAWQSMNPERFFMAVMCDAIVKVYYAHPAAWNEIGYGGPASPRGHSRKAIGRVDPWEAHESRTGRRDG